MVQVACLKAVSAAELAVWLRALVWRKVQAVRQLVCVSVAELKMTRTNDSRLQMMGLLDRLVLRA